MKKIVKAMSAFGVMTVIFLLTVFYSFAAQEALEVKAENTENGISLSWTGYEDIYYYELYRQSNVDKTKVLIAKAQDTSFEDTDTVGGVLYSYSVVPVFLDYEAGQESAGARIYRLESALVVNAVAEKKGLRIEWSVVEGAEGYRVFRREKGTEKWQKLRDISSSSTVCKDETALPGVNYEYTVRAFAGKKLGATGNSVELTCVDYPKIIGTAITEKGVAFKWKKVDGAEYYLIYRKDPDGTVPKPYAVLDGVYDRYEDTNVKEGVAYSYVVRGIIGEGKYTPYDSQFALKHIKESVILRAESASDGIRLTWSKSAGCSGYAVYKKRFGTAEWTFAGLVKGENTLSATDRKVGNGNVYTYIVRAVWNKQLSNYDEKGATVRYIAPPSSLSCETGTTRGNVLTWDENSTALCYYVYRRTAGADWKIIARTYENRYADSKAAADGKYDYMVRSYKTSACYSAASETVLTYKVTMDSSTKMVALTFDDGPSDTITNGILDILEEYDARATFFVVGQNIGYGYEAMARASKMGCEIGTHTYSHIDLPSSSSSTIRDEIAWTDELVEKYTGSPTRVARAPGGALDESSAMTVNKPFFYWSVDTRDWESRDADSVISIVQNYTEDGAIILMHDIYESTLEAAEYVIPWLISEGYELVTVSELMMYKSGITPVAGVTYYDGFDG